MLEPRANMTWKATYKGSNGSGTTVCVLPPPHPTDKPLCVPLQDVCKLYGVSTTSAGHVETRVLKPGPVATFPPVSITTEVKSVKYTMKF